LSGRFLCKVFSLGIMREEREGEEEVDFKELRRLIEELKIKIWQLYSRWRERKRKGLMIEKSKEYFF